MKPRQYSLEQRLVEPFRAIRSIEISSAMVISSIFGFLGFLSLWWFGREMIFNFWIEVLNFLISITGEPWTVSQSSWPGFANPLLALPILSADIPPPTIIVWWSFTFFSIALFLFSDTWRPSLLPLRATTHFVLFLLGVSLACFAIAPTQFEHSVEEWSKVYFLGAYGSLIIYAIIWTCGVLWFPISTWVKIVVSLILLLYFLVGTPLLLFLCTLTLHFASLLLLPLFALAIAPLLQLGWFVSFYSLALSAGSDLNKEVVLE